MAYRSALRRVLARSQTRAFHSAVSIKPVLQSLVSQESDACGKNGWKESDFSSHFRELRNFSNRRKGSFSQDSNEGSKGIATFPGIVGPAYGFRCGTRNPMALGNVREERKTGLCDTQRQSSDISSAHFALLASFGNFAVHELRVSASTNGSIGFRKGSLNRSFSSVPVSAEGTQIGVAGESLDSLQAGLTGVGDAASKVANLPNAGTLSEVAVAAADCSYPIAFVQYVIDGVHVSSGLPWWASIVATTVAIRVLVLPIMVYQMKATARLTLMRPELEKLTNHVKESGYDPEAVEENQIRMKALFKKHKTSPLSPILGAFIQAPLFMCFFFGIRNMAEKMESFKAGGTLWFTDLSTPDSLFILPVLSGAFFLLTVELGATDGMQGQPILARMKLFLRGLAVLLVPLTASFPKALFCYWLTANVCSIIQAAVLKQPGAKAMLGIPDVSLQAKPADTPVVTFSQSPRLKGETISKRQRS